MLDPSIDKLRRWMDEKNTAILWIHRNGINDEPSIPKEAMRAAQRRFVALDLSAGDVDSVLRDAMGSEEEGRELSTARLIHFAGKAELLFIDHFELIQAEGEEENHIVDSRFRQLLVCASDGALMGTAIAVASSCPPPQDLSSASITELEGSDAQEQGPVSLPATTNIERSILDLAALTPFSITVDWLAERSPNDKAHVQQSLLGLVRRGFLLEQSPERFTLAPAVRARLVGDEERLNEMCETTIEYLQNKARDPEWLFELLCRAGRINEAVGTYWHQLGNYSRLESQGRSHYGARCCRLLNGGRSPQTILPALRESEGAWAVMNDWALFALAGGDIVTAVPAAECAYQLVSKSNPEWDSARLAAHVAGSYLLSGDLAAAMKWCESAWMHSRLGMRQTEGFAVREIMDAYDWSANTMGKIYLRLGEAQEIRRLMGDLAVIHRRAIESIHEFNQSSIFPLSVPSEQDDADQLVDGRLAAMLAFLEGRYKDLKERAANSDSSVARKELELLCLRGEIAEAVPSARVKLEDLRREAEHSDDCVVECELALLMTRLHDSDPAEMLDIMDTYISRAAAGGLGLYWRDLQLARAQVLIKLDRKEEAQFAALAALNGHAGIGDAMGDSDWHAVRETVTALRLCAAEIPQAVDSALQHSPPHHEPLRRTLYHRGNLQPQAVSMRENPCTRLPSG